MAPINTHTFTRVPLGLLAIAFALATLLPSLAAAQVSEVEPRYVVVEAEGATLRSGDLRNYYPIAEAEVGQVFRVDGAGRNWLRVNYPLQARALIRGDRGEYDRSAGIVRLTAPGRPKAWNLEYGVNGSWKDIPTDMLPAGTEFKFIEVATDRNGATHYVVEAPRMSRAFIETAHVRDATQSEASAYLNTVGGERALVGDAARQPRAERSAPLAPPAGSRPESLPEPTRQATAEQPPAGETDQTEIADAPSRTPVAAPTPDPTERPVAGLQELDRAFQNVQKQRALDAELDPLLSEFRTALDSVTRTPENEPLRLALEQRISVLEIRKDLQQQLQEVAAARSSADAYTSRVVTAANTAKASRQYTIIGRLETSAIYDGDRLPLMYRIQSVGESSPRTLGYIRPRDDMDLRERTGQLVGVIGRTALDERLKLNIVTPITVDTLSAETPAASQQASVRDDG